MSWKNSSMCSLSQLLTISFMASLLVRLYFFLPGFVSTLSPRLSSKVFCLASLSSLWNALMLCQMLGRLLPLRLKDLLKDSMSLLVVFSPSRTRVKRLHDSTLQQGSRVFVPMYVLYKRILKNQKNDFSRSLKTCHICQQSGSLAAKLINSSTLVVYLFTIGVL